MPAEPDLILASASPRRLELLERVGLVPLVIPADVDETPHAGEKPIDYARRVAGSKCDAIEGGPATQGRTLAVLGADTTVVVDDAILGKPVDESDARAMLGRLAGRRHEVVTAYRIRHGARRSNARSRPRCSCGRFTQRSSTLTSPQASGAARPGVTRSRGSPPPSSPSCAAPFTTSSASPWPRYWRICRRWVPCPATRDRDSRRRDPGGRDRRRTGGGSHPHRRRRAGRRTRSGLGSADRRQQENACRRRAGGHGAPASGPSAKTTARSCATSAPRRRAIPSRPSGISSGRYRATR